MSQEQGSTVTKATNVGNGKGKGAPRTQVNPVDPVTITTPVESGNLENHQVPSSETPVTAEHLAQDVVEAGASIATVAGDVAELGKDAAKLLDGKGDTAAELGEVILDAGKLAADAVVAGEKIGEIAGHVGEVVAKAADVVVDTAVNVAHEVSTWIQLHDHIMVDVRQTSNNNGRRTMSVEDLIIILLQNDLAKPSVKPNHVPSILKLLQEVERVKGYPSINETLRQRAIRNFRFANTVQ